MNPKVTALVPTYRRPKYLKRAILSVLNQSYEDLRLSIFDNASGDNTKDIVCSLSENDSRIKYHCHTSNIGALANFRYAFESVDTPYFSILSDDDCLSMDFYKDAIDVLDNNPELMFVVLNVLKIDENSDLSFHRECTGKLKKYSKTEGFDEIHSGNIEQTWTGMLFRKEVAEVYLEMDDRHDKGHDMRFLFRAASRYNFAYLSKIGAFFTWHNESISSTFKNVDLVHQGVQISRYVEIIFDENVEQAIKEKALLHIKRLFNLKPNFIYSLKKIIQNFLDPTSFKNTKVEEDIKDYKFNGFSKRSMVLEHIHNSKIVKTIIRFLFIGSYKKMLSRKKTKLLSLQNGVYKKYFDYISIKN